MRPSFSKIFGATLLVAGCCAGAGMLGIPLVSNQAGFIPSSFILCLSWAFMLLTAFLFLEATLWFKGEINLLTITEHTVGKTGKWIACLLFLFLFDCLLVAYLSASSSILAHFLNQNFGLTPAHWKLTMLVALLGIQLLFLGTHAIDLFNRSLMAGFILSYLCLLAFGFPFVDVSQLERQEWSSAWILFPPMIISFGYHNLIPSLTTYLDRDRKALRLVLVVGSVLPLIAYLLWNAVIFGLIPTDSDPVSQTAEGEVILSLLRQGRAGAYFSFFMQTFSFFAILTSFLGVSLSFIDFLADGLHVKKKKKNRIFLALLTIVPPALFSLAFTGIFIQALNYAGAFGAVLLFGALPCLIVWKGRDGRDKSLQMVPGGKGVLLLILLGATFIFSMQLIREVSL